MLNAVLSSLCWYDSCNLSDPSCRLSEGSTEYIASNRGWRIANICLSGCVLCIIIMVSRVQITVKTFDLSLLFEFFNNCQTCCTKLQNLLIKIAALQLQYRILKLGLKQNIVSRIFVFLQWLVNVQGTFKAPNYYFV